VLEFTRQPRNNDLGRGRTAMKDMQLHRGRNIETYNRVSRMDCSHSPYILPMAISDICIYMVVKRELI
jgi:hypothetical protein